MYILTQPCKTTPDKNNYYDDTVNRLLLTKILGKKERKNNEKKRKTNKNKLNKTLRKKRPFRMHTCTGEFGSSLIIPIKHYEKKYHIAVNYVISLSLSIML